MLQANSPHRALHDGAPLALDPTLASPFGRRRAGWWGTRPRPSGGSVEVRGFVCDPFEEALHVFALVQGVEVCVCFGEVVVGDMGVDGAVADGVNRDRLVAALTLRDGVVVFDSSA